MNLDTHTVNICWHFIHLSDIHTAYEAVDALWTYMHPLLFKAINLKISQKKWDNLTKSFISLLPSQPLHDTEAEP